MELYERIRLLRKDYLKLSMEAFGNRLGVSRDVINNIEHNRLAKPEQKLSLIKLMCKEFSVNEEWILNGTDPMFIETPSSTMEQLRKEFNLDDFSYNLVYEYLKLGQDQRKWFRDFLYRVMKDGDSPASQEINPDELTTADAEAEYKKSFSASAHGKKSPVSSTTDGTAGDKKASNE